MVFIYANASRKLGFGHIMRQIALIEALIDQNQQVFLLCHEITQELVLKLEATGVKVCQLEAEVDWVQKLPEMNTLIVDDYNVSDADFEQLRKKAKRLVLFDDNTYLNLPFLDLIINPSDFNKTDLRANKTLQGSDFRLVRSEFIPYRSRLRFKPGYIFVCLGGSDAQALSVAICKMLLTSQQVTKIVLAVSSTCDHRTLYALEGLKSSTKFELHIDSNKLPMLMSDADIAITGAGGSLYELMFLGVPSIALVVADNQSQALYSPLNNNAYSAIDGREEIDIINIVDTALLLLDSADKKNVYTQQSAKVVDGLAASRICDAILHLIRH